MHLRIDALQREKDDLLALWQGKEKEKIGHITEISPPDNQVCGVCDCCFMMMDNQASMAVSPAPQAPNPSAFSSHSDSIFLFK